LDAAACKRRALDLLARREHSRFELQHKLAARGATADLIAATLDELAASGVLADARFTESFIRSRVAKGQGPVRIRAELAQRGIASAKADELLRAAEIDWVQATRAVRAKRFGAEQPGDYHERARQARFLQSRGFESAHVRAALELESDSD
jgi:regulatory protein